jgi:hypothetical protein
MGNSGVSLYRARAVLKSFDYNQSCLSRDAQEIESWREVGRGWKFHRA